jgi:hypothetical protein
MTRSNRCIERTNPSTIKPIDIQKAKGQRTAIGGIFLHPGDASAVGMSDRGKTGVTPAISPKRPVLVKTAKTNPAHLPIRPHAGPLDDCPTVGGD